MSSHAKRIAALVLACALALLVAACGEGDSPSGNAAPPDYEKALRDAPPPLAKLYAQGNELLPGGKEAFEKRLEVLRGYPVVVNVWASWCGGCLLEFPMLQKLSARFGTRVAFVGVDSEDSEDAAATWLADTPVPYPSFSDPDREVAREFGAVGLPATAFLDRNGELVWLKQGAYRDEDELEAEIKQYALGVS